MRVTAKVDYAIRAALELAAAEPATPVKGDTVARAQRIPLRFLENILRELRHAGIVHTARGPDGCLDPDAIAQTYLHLHRQHRSSWASHIELRPWSEKF